MKIINLRLGDYRVNTYIVYKEKRSDCTVIDPGDGYSAIEDAIRENGLTLSSIILTHAHFDHIASLADLKDKYNCKVFMHCEEAEILGDSEKNLTKYFLDKETQITLNDGMLSDFETFESAGLEFSVMHTPGHTKGSAVFKCEDILFTGDTLFSNGCGRCDLWSGSVESMKASLDKIFSEKGDLIFYPGHGPQSSLNKIRDVYKFFI